MSKIITPYIEKTIRTRKAWNVHHLQQRFGLTRPQVHQLVAEGVRANMLRACFNQFGQAKVVVL